MPTATYRFIRDLDTKDGLLANFTSSNRPSTDALNALYRWLSANPDRKFENLKDEDDELVAKLTWDDSDHSAGPSLESHCARSGITRHYLGQ